MSWIQSRTRLKHPVATIFIALSAIGIYAKPVFGQELTAQPAQLQPFSSAGGSTPPAPWRIVGLPKASISPTRFDMVPVDGPKVLRIRTDKSYANLAHDLPNLAVKPGTMLRWRWRLDQPLNGTDMRRKEADDSPLKVCAMFDMPIERLGFVERNLLRAARSVSGENLPAATLCYVWDATLPAGTLLDNAYSRRLRFIVLDSGQKQLGQWVAHSQDLAADFRRAFGDESLEVPPLQGVLVGGDSDNTGGQSLGYIGDITLFLLR